ncbi:cytochrome P450 [Mycena galericulata]|nr:cytochrome P450 [Mycena galericulata]
MSKETVVLGHIPQLLLSKEYGEHEFDWQETYGKEPRLMISDPSAMKFIMNSGIFVWGPAHGKAANMFFGHDNIFLARGDAHRRLRNLMNPFFSSNNLRELLPNIREIGRKLVDRWESLGFVGKTVDISCTLNDAALDVIGNGKMSFVSAIIFAVTTLFRIAILEHPFNALTGQSELARIQRKMIDSLSNPTKFGQLLDAVLPYVPDPIFRLAFHLPISSMGLIREYHKMTEELSFNLAAQKRDDVGSGFIGGFVGEGGVPDQEIGTHLRSILGAGQDSTGGTLGWILYRLAQMTDFQQELRQEIQVASIKDQPDYNSMPLLNAVINEVLRMYTPLPLLERVVTEDCVVPLSQPITTTSGIQISEIPMKKGECLYVAVAAYHRLTSIWGPDAREFRPSRWLQKEPGKGPVLGPHAPTLLELQVFVVEIVGRFVLSLPENDSVRARVALTLVAECGDGARKLPVHVEHVA